MKTIKREELRLSRLSELLTSTSTNGVLPSTAVLAIPERFPKTDYACQIKTSLQIWVIEGKPEVTTWTSGERIYSETKLYPKDCIEIAKNELFSIRGACVVAVLSSDKKEFSLKIGKPD